MFECVCSLLQLISFVSLMKKNNPNYKSSLDMSFHVALISVFVFVDTGTKCVISEPLGCGPEMETSNKMEEKREKQKSEVSLRAEQDRQSYEVVETLRKRREDMAAKDIINEKKLKEKEER